MPVRTFVSAGETICERIVLKVRRCVSVGEGICERNDLK